MFHITPADKSYYGTLFDKLGPQAGRVSGEEVREILIKDYLPSVTELNKIMYLASQDEDGHGFLDRNEFIAACQLAVTACSYQIPDQVYRDMSLQ